MIKSTQLKCVETDNVFAHFLMPKEGRNQKEENYGR